MEHVFDFIHAALPWVAIGLFLAVFAVRSAKQRKAGKSKDTKPQEDYGIIGMCIGMCLGSAVGVSGTVSIGISMCLGMAIGLAVGTCIKKEERGDSDKT